LRPKIEDDHYLAWAFRAHCRLAPLIFHLIVRRFLGHDDVVHVTFT
jgi:hypothetical protein